MSYCQTCYTELRPSQSQSVFQTPCCAAPICAQCIARNPRLKEYSPCLRCGDVRTDSGNREIRDGRRRAEQARRREEAGRFTIGDDEDEGDNPKDHEDAPPGYTSDPERSTMTAKTQHYDAIEPAAKRTGDIGDFGVEAAAVAKAEEELVAAEVRHPVSRSDTILSIARKYAADPHELLALNSLPYSTLSTQPHLLRTRRTLVISRRLVPKSRLPASTQSSRHTDDVNDDHVQYSELHLALHGSEEDAASRQRAEERRIKRFQLITKTADPAVGRAYVGLAAAEEEPDSYGVVSGAADALVWGGGGRDEGLGVGYRGGGGGRVGLVGAGGAWGSGGGVAAWGGEGMGGKKRAIPDQSNRAERAVEQYLDDDEWERECGGLARATRGVDGRWKVVGSRSDLAVALGVKG